MPRQPILWLDPRTTAGREKIEAAWAVWPAADLFHHPTWFWPNVDAISSPAAGLRFALLGDPAAPLALIPLERRRIPKLPLRMYGFLDDRGTCPEAAIFLRRGQEAEAASALVSGLRAPLAPGFLDLSGLDSDGPFCAGLRRVLGEAAVPRPPQRQYYIRFASDADGYTAALSGKQRQNLRRAWRALEAQGRVRSVARTVEAAEAYDTVEAVDHRSWRFLDTGRKLTATQSATQVNAMFRRLIEDLRDGAVHRIGLLHLDDAVIGASYTAHYGGTAYIFKINFDEQLREVSPGMIVLHEAIVDAARLGASGCEFMARTFQAQRFATHERRIAAAIHPLPGPSAGAAAVALRLAYRLGTSAKAGPSGPGQGPHRSTR